MTDQINEQISAFIDDELSADENALLVRRLERDGEARARAMRYTLIGAALRNELLKPQPMILSQRVAAALSGAAPAAGQRRARAFGRIARPLMGVGIAATVALMAIGSLRFLNGSVAGDAGGAVAATPAPTAEAPSYIVPSDGSGTDVTAPPIRLTNYLMHHGVYASGVTRTTVNSNVVGADAEAPADEAAQTPAERVPAEAE